MIDLSNRLVFFIIELLQQLDWISDVKNILWRIKMADHKSEFISDEETLS